MNKKWEYCKVNEEDVIEFSQKFNISQLLAKILINRDITEKEEVDKFLKPTRNDFYNPFLILDMEKATQRIIKAIKNKEKVIIYGDYDVDGITSITVLKKFLQERELVVDYYIPNRLEEGYGLNKDAIKKIIENEYSLIITVDCGITSIEEIGICNDNGIETIITDHHEPLEILPNAYAIIDTKRKDNEYPFRELAGVGIVFKLIQAISIKMNLDEKEYLKYLDFVCVGTISDIVPLIDENRVIAKLGLKLVAQTKNLGLKELINEIGYKTINSATISFGIAPRINACGRMGFQEEALKLFLTDDIEKVKEITQKLNVYNVQRQEKEKIIFEEALKKIEEENLNSRDGLIISGDNWHNGVIGIVASKITERFFKPTILISFDEDNGKGSGRSIPGFDLHEALTLSSQYLEKYGGHSMAIGLTIKKEQLEDFRDCFEEIVKANNVKDIIQVIKIDTEINSKDMNLQTINDILMLEPFGEKNKLPIVSYKNLKIESIRSLSEGKHLKLTLRDDNNIIIAMGFNLGYLADEFLIGDKVDIAGNLEKNTFNGMETIQINLKDIMKSI